MIRNGLLKGLLFFRGSVLEHGLGVFWLLYLLDLLWRLVFLLVET